MQEAPGDDVVSSGALKENQRAQLFKSGAPTVSYAFTPPLGRVVCVQFG